MVVDGSLEYLSVKRVSIILVNWNGWQDTVECLQSILQLNYKPVGNKLLPEEFTMPELQKLYEIILGKSLNRGNFYRKMMAYDILDKQEGTRKGGAHKAPNLYKFNLERYKEALKDGFKEGW